MVDFKLEDYVTMNMKHFSVKHFHSMSVLFVIKVQQRAPLNKRIIFLKYVYIIYLHVKRFKYKKYDLCTHKRGFLKHSEILPPDLVTICFVLSEVRLSVRNRMSMSL